MRLVIIQCDAGQTTQDLIACARYRTYDLRAQDTSTHILFVIYVPRNCSNSSSFGFQGDPWISFHIDNLRSHSDSAVPVGQSITMSMSELFIGNQREIEDESETDNEHHGEDSCSDEKYSSMLSIKPSCYVRLRSCIQAATSKLDTSSIRRCTRQLIKLIPTELSTGRLGKRLIIV